MTTGYSVKIKKFILFKLACFVKKATYSCYNFIMRRFQLLDREWSGRWCRVKIINIFNF